MRVIRNYFNSVYKNICKPRGLREYERHCLNTWSKAVHSRVSHYITRQMETMTVTDRHANDKVVKLDCNNRFSSKTRLPDEYRFAYEKQEEAIAVTILFAKHEKKLRANILVYDGRISSIAFSHPPLSFFDTMNEVTVENMIPLLDLAHPYFQPQPIKEPVTLIPWIRQAVDRLQPHHLMTPCSKDHVQSRIHYVETYYEVKIPSDYTALNLELNGLKNERIEVFGVDETWIMTYPEHTYIALAEILYYGFIVLIEGDSSGTLYKIEYDSPDTPWKLNKSLRKVLMGGLGLLGV